MQSFKDGQFRSAAEKLKTFKAMDRFLGKNCQEKYFTDRVYNFLYLSRFGFIAHYNKAGFFAARFADEQGRLATLERILNEHSAVTFDHPSGDTDLHAAVQSLFKLHAESIRFEAKANRIERLKAIIAKAQGELNTLTQE